MKRQPCPACGEPVDLLKQGALMNVRPGAHPFHLMTCPGAPVSTSILEQAAPQGDMDRVKRNQWGQPLIVPPGGGKAVGYQRVTTFIKVMESGFGLEQWKLRQVVCGLRARPDLQKAVDAHAPGYLDGDLDDKKTLDEVCKAALDAAASSGKATIGTALHRITERHDRGQLDDSDVPDWARADLAAYRAATAGMQWLAIEKMHVNDNLKVAGTPDRIALVDGVPTVVDLKTGSFWASSCAAQLGVYANSQVYDIATGQRTATDYRTDWGLVIHLPAGSGQARLRKVDIGHGWVEVSDCAPRVHAWQKNKKLDLGDYTPPVSDTPVLDLVAQVASATSPDDLMRLYRAAVEVGAWSDDMKALFSQRKGELLQGAA